MGMKRDTFYIFQTKELLNIIDETPKTVSQLASELDISVKPAWVRTKLEQLFEQGIIQRKTKNGIRVYYKPRVRK